MKIAIIGGKLQGIEACYLAKRAGYETVLIDKDPAAPASGLADEFICEDLVEAAEGEGAAAGSGAAREGDSAGEGDPAREGNSAGSEPAVINALKEADLVLPTNENRELLQAMEKICSENRIPMAFDMRAYDITESKRASDTLFLKNGIPCPRYFPEGRAPYIAKPEEGSGSAEVIRLETRKQAEVFRRTHPRHIIQEFVEGPAYSIEVIGRPGEYRTYEVTDIHVDQDYDCYRVTAPSELSEELQKEFADIAVKLAELVQLHGIMDVEAIYDGRSLRVLEIDARLPSQTPAVVLESSGANLLKELVDVTLNGGFTGRESGGDADSSGSRKDLGYADVSGFQDGPGGGGNMKYVCYEHYVRGLGELKQIGEHCMAAPGQLKYIEGFPGARVAITDYENDSSDFRGIFINWADTAEEVEEWRNTLLRKLKG